MMEVEELLFFGATRRITIFFSKLNFCFKTPKIVIVIFFKSYKNSFNTRVQYEHMYVGLYTVHIRGKFWNVQFKQK